EGDAVRGPGDQPGHDQREPPRPADAPAYPVVRGEGGERADGQVRAHREVREAEELPEERERDGGQGPDAARAGAVPEELGDRRHPAAARPQGARMVTCSILPFRTWYTPNGRERMSPIASKSQDPDAPS